MKSLKWFIGCGNDDFTFKANTELVLSMGGMQTLYLTNNHPELFSYFGVLSMGLMENRQGAANTSAEDQMKGLEKLKASKPKLYWIGI